MTTTADVRDIMGFEGGPAPGVAPKKKAPKTSQSKKASQSSHNAESAIKQS